METLKSIRSLGIAIVLILSLVFVLVSMQEAERVRSDACCSDDPRNGNPYSDRSG